MGNHQEGNQQRGGRLHQAQQPHQPQHQPSSQQQQIGHYDEQGYDDQEPYEEEEAFIPEGGEGELKMQTAFWGSASLFHALLLMVLAFITIGAGGGEVETVVEIKAPPEPREEVEFEKKNKDEVKSPIQDQKVVKHPKVAEKYSDHNEEDVDKKFDEDIGENTKFHSDANLQSDQISDAIGLGGGAGGNFGPGRGGDEDLGTKGGSNKTQNAVLDALIWLAKHQSPDGHWDVWGYTNQCEGDICKRSPDLKKGRTIHNIGTTGLALLAFLGAGKTHLTEEVHEGINFGDVVKKGLFWLKEQQKDDGSFTRSGVKPMYNNAIATLAFAEAYGMTGSTFLQQHAQKAVDYVQQAQNPYKAWKYKYQNGRNDVSVTGWCVMALKSGQIAGLKVDPTAMENAVQFVDEATDKRFGLVGYESASDVGGKIYVEGFNGNYANHPAMTAVGMLTRMFVNKNLQSEALKKGVAHLTNDLPQWQEGAGVDTSDNPIDYYYWYYGSLAMYMYAAPGSQNEAERGKWKKWNDAMKKALLPSQETEQDGHEHGSWDPVARWAFEGGRVYSTAINALTFEVYYRYDHAFGIDNEEK